LGDVFGILAMAEHAISHAERQRRRLAEPLAELTLEHVVSGH
jgi:hypothetical protein